MLFGDLMKFLKYIKILSYLNDTLISGEPLENFQKIITKWKKSDHYISCIGFLSYELNEIIYNHLNFKKN